MDAPRSYGANNLLTTSHVIPWDPFDPGSELNPFDFGSSISELPDGNYNIDLVAFSESDPLNPGLGLECQVRDSSESLTMTKSGGVLIFS